MRVADIGPSGQPANLYSGTAPVDGAAPAVPYAVYLADASRRYRLLGFDLDVKAGPVGEDVEVLVQLLAQAGITAPVVCESGPDGGMHVWLALAEPAPAALVTALARGLRAHLLSLDASALLNPATGCLRPPGAPHRVAGRSRVVAGDPSTLLQPTVRLEQLQALLELVSAGEGVERQRHGPVRQLPRDGAGHRHLPGPRTALPAAAAAALAAPVPATADASAVLWRVLLGAVRSRWRAEHVFALLVDVEGAPGLEHARSARTRALRVVRSPREQRQRLGHQWERAVSHVLARESESTGDDPTWDGRVEQVVELVDVAQARAGAAPGRWARAGGASDRKVLDAVCLLTLDAVRPAVDIDVRRLAERCGFSRETARVALARLARDGWIRQARASSGPHAAAWTLQPVQPAQPVAAETTSPGSSTAGASTGLSQAISRPEGAPLRRTAWTRTLRARLDAQAHDVFTPRPGLGQHAGRIYSATSTVPRTRAQLVTELGYSPAHIDRLTAVLYEHGLIRPGPGGTWRRTRRSRATVAADLGVDGVLRRRRRRHQLEREAWAWWLDELDWMRARRADKVRRRDPAPGQLVLPLAMLTPRRRLGPHPRRPDGRADFRAAAGQLANPAQRKAS